MTTGRVAPVQNGVLRARIIRADGTVDDLGVIAASYASPWRRSWWVCVGKPLARARSRAANRRALIRRHPRED